MTVRTLHHYDRAGLLSPSGRSGAGHRLHSYATEEQLKWRDSAGQMESMARAAAHSKEDWRRLMGEAAAWRAELLAAFDDGEPVDGERAMDPGPCRRIPACPAASGTHSPGRGTLSRVAEPTATTS